MLVQTTSLTSRVKEELCCWEERPDERFFSPPEHFWSWRHDGPMVLGVQQTGQLLSVLTHQLGGSECRASLLAISSIY